MYFQKIILIITLYTTGFSKTGYPAFDVFTSSTEVSMGGASFLMASTISSKLNPSVVYKGRGFSTSVIRYPADITSQSAGLIFPWSNGQGSLSIRHIAYGVFEGYNDNLQSSGTYRSSDTWVRSTYSQEIKGRPIRTGISFQYFNSSLQNSSINILDFSLGALYFFNRSKSSFGISVHQLGKTMFENASGFLKPQIVLSGSRKLAYLPLKLYIDTIVSKKLAIKEIYLGGMFDFHNNIQIRLGTSTRKIDHNLRQDLLKTILGATGFGITYISGNTSVNYGTFIYGTGTWIQGLEIGIDF